jgi:hypothetical protein
VINTQEPENGFKTTTWFSDEQHDDALIKLTRPEFGWFRSKKKCFPMITRD